MSPERAQPTEYTHADGFTLRFHMSPHEQEWSKFGNAITYLEGRETAAAILNRQFVETTLAMKNPGISPSVEAADVTLSQQGRKNAIHKVTVGKESFIFVMSKGTPELKEEMKREFNNLRQLREKLEERSLPLFVPQTYIMGESGKVASFSFEYLPNHLELHALGLLVGNKYYTGFGMVAENQKAQRFNKRAEKETVKWSRLPPDKYSLDPNYRIKLELIARLYIIFELTGCVPSEFSINAGDFMADPDKEDFDLRLITVRGGWQLLGDETAFGLWLYNCEFARATPEEQALDLKRPLFDYNLVILNEGWGKGKEMLSHAFSPRDPRRPGAGRR